MTPSSASVVEKIDSLLGDDKNFTTRTGLRFMTTILKEAMLVIGDAAENKQSVDTRLRNMENALQEFFELRKKEQEKADAERAKWRWAIILPMIGILLNELAKWIFG